MGYFDVTGADVPRALFPTGRVKVSLRTRKKTEDARRRAELAKLRTWGAWDLLRAIADGRLHVATVANAVRSDGEAAIAALRRQLEEERLGQIPTVRQATQTYLVWYRRERRSKSLKQITSRLKRFAEQRRADGTELGQLRIDQVTKADVEEGMHGVGGADGTMEGIRLAVSGLFTWLIAEERERARTDGGTPRWTENPAGLVPARKSVKRVVTATPQQSLALLLAAEPYQEAYARAFLHLGLREAELIHIRLHDDLDLRDWTIRIQHRPPDARCGCPDCQGPKGWGPKTARGARAILVPEWADDAGTVPHPLRAAIQRNLEMYPCAPGDFVFRNPRTGRVWDVGVLADDFKRLCTRAGITYGSRVPGGLFLHALRHTCATELIRAGVGVPEIAALLGDSETTITETYIHLTPADIARAIRRGPAYTG